MIRSPHRLPGAATALLLLFVTLGPGTAHAQSCPAALVHVQNYAATPVHVITAVAWDSVLVDTWTTHVRFDRTVRTCALEAASGGRASSDLRLTDRLDVLGAAAGTLVPATLELSLAGHSEQNCGGSGCGVTFEVTLVAGADSTTANANHQGPSNTSRSLPPALSLPVVLVAGTPLDVQVHVHYGTGPGQSSALGDVTATYQVTGLPPSLEASWCGGEVTVPARLRTWGTLKSRYR